jgi:glycosyltransferase involved in cell wall biosynthesis
MARILHLISQLEEGGAQRQLAYVVSRLSGYQMEIASLINSPEEKLFPFFRNANVPIHFLSDRSDFYAPEILPRLKQLVEKGGYSLIHCWLFEAIVQGLIAARASQIPCIGSPRNVLESLILDSSRKWERLLIHRAVRNVDIAIFPSYSVAADFVDAGWARARSARVILNGVDTEHFIPGNEEGNAVVSVARHTQKKGLEDFQWIAERLKQKNPSLEFLLAGGIPKSDQTIQYVGHVADVREVFRRASVFVSTSRVEGMGNAILEAQAMGLPVVARPLGPTTEVINDGVNGLFAETREGLLSACEKLIQDRQLRSEMGRKARENTVARFEISAQMKKIEDVYSELL